MKEYAVNAFLSLVSLFVALLFVETLLRLNVLGLNFPINHYRVCSGPSIPLRYNGDDLTRTIGWTFHPESIFLNRRSTLDNWSWYHHNELGFRSTKGSGENNTIVLGDSFVYGSRVSNPQTIPYLLDEWNPQRTYRNFGMLNFSTYQEFLLYREIHDDLDHDQVILGYYFNDPFNAFDRIEQRPTSKRRHEAPHDKQSNQRTFLDSVNFSLSNHTFLYPFLKNYLSYSQTSWPKSLTKPERFEKRLRTTKRLVDSIADLAENVKSNLLIVAIPPREILRGKALGPYSSKTVEFLWEKQHSMLSSVSRQNANVELLLIESKLRELIKEGHQLYGPVDRHFNARGYRTVSVMIRDRNNLASKSPESNRSPTREHTEKLRSCDEIPISSEP